MEIFTHENLLLQMEFYAPAANLFFCLLFRLALELCASAFLCSREACSLQTTETTLCGGSFLDVSINLLACRLEHDSGFTIRSGQASVTGFLSSVG